MSDISLKVHEREVESARAKLTEDLTVLCSARTFATFTDDLKQEALDTKDAVWEKLKARAAANPAAMRHAAKSFDSRVGNENAVRRSVAPASFISARSRAQRT